MKVDGAGKFSVKEQKQFMFFHNNCSKVRGTNEELQMSENLNYFLVWVPKGGANSYIIYKFLSNVDENGY
jgi:5,10-methenyltetrahydromethanopterin hydrogenase